MAKHIFLFSIIVIFSVFSRASTMSLKTKLGVHYLEQYQEGDVYILDHYLREANTFQRRIDQKKFKSKIELNRFIENYNPENEFIFSKKDEFKVLEKESIWTVKNEWNLDWEDKYATWIRDTLYKDYFVDKNMSTDCADVLFVLRWIFARDNSLPAANSLAGSGDLFTQDVFFKKWKGLKRAKNWEEDEVFLAAMAYLKDNAYTKSLGKDSYPIKLTRESFREGVSQLFGNHVRVISKINYDGSGAPILKLSSTIPSKVRVLQEEVLLDMKSIPADLGGFMKFRWPVKKGSNWALLPAREMPWYSDEQYKEEYLTGKTNFTKDLIVNKLKISMNAKATIATMVGALQSFILNRKRIVNEGYRYCRENDCSIGTQGYEDWSTPSRDKRILEYFSDIYRTIDDLKTSDPSLEEFYQALTEKNRLDYQGSHISLEDVFKLFYYEYPSYDPNDEPDLRWGWNDQNKVDSLKLKFDRLEKKRAKKIKAAEVCRKSLNCLQGSEEWESLNTYNYDFELKRYLRGAVKLCEKGKNYCLPHQNKDLSSIAHYSSNPNDNIEVRLGKKQISYLLPIGEDLEELAANLILVDEKKVFDLNSSAFLDIGLDEKWIQKIIYSGSKDALYILYQKKLFEFSLSDSKLNEVNLSSYNNQLVDIELFEDTLFFYTGYQDHIYTLGQYDLKAQTLASEKKSLINAISEKDICKELSRNICYNQDGITYISNMKTFETFEIDRDAKFIEASDYIYTVDEVSIKRLDGEAKNISYNFYEKVLSINSHEDEITLLSVSKKVVLDLELKVISETNFSEMSAPISYNLNREQGRIVSEKKSYFWIGDEVKSFSVSTSDYSIKNVCFDVVIEKSQNDFNIVLENTSIKKSVLDVSLSCGYQKNKSVYQEYSQIDVAGITYNLSETFNAFGMRLSSSLSNIGQKTSIDQINFDFSTLNAVQVTDGVYIIMK